MCKCLSKILASAGINHLPPAKNEGLLFRFQTQLCKHEAAA